MTKDPAFLFYPNDYIGGTMGWSFEEKGAYIELLMMQFNRGHMTEHMVRHTVGQLWDTIKVKFKKDPEGLYYNQRLETEKIKRSDYTASRRNNLEGVNQYSESGHTTSRMENENEDVNINKDKRFTPPTINEVTAYCLERKNQVDAEYFIDFYASKGWMIGKNKMKDWKSALRRAEKWKESTNKPLTPINTRATEEYPDFPKQSKEDQEKVSKLISETAKKL